MVDLIIIGGAPGTGKSTLAGLLKADLGSVWIDFGMLRQLHLDADWSNTSEEEHEMAFENLVFVLRNYLSYGYRDVIVDDLQDWRIADLAEAFDDRDCRIVTLLLNDVDEHRRRIESRNAGWRDVERAVAWNREVTDRMRLAHETRIDTSRLGPREVANRVIDLVGARANS